MTGKVIKWSNMQLLASGFMLVGLYAIAMLSSSRGVPIGLAFSFSPLLLLAFMTIITNPYWGLMAIFFLNYFIMGISRYVTIASIGVSTDAFIAIIIISIIVRSTFMGDIPWERAKSTLVKLMLLWIAFCVFEIVNPSSVFAAWIAGMRSYAIYPFFIVLFTTMFFYKYRDFKIILFIWSVFTLMAILKSVMQQRWGWDAGELKWLSEGLNANTHILATGNRYFSFFTDAGNFGSNMGCSLVVFSLSAFFVKNKNLSLYYLFVATAGGYGMFISGTRGALAVPFAGYVLYTVLSKNVKSMVTVGVFVVFAYLFFTYTNIGQGNSYISRMRTAFDQNDASLLVRKANQKKLGEYLRNKPFGEGLGLSGTEAAKYAPGRLTTSIPNDSWFVKIWVETGIIGLIFHLGLLLFSVVYGTYIILTKIKDKELRGYLAAITCGLMGMMASAYGNAFFMQYPTDILMYMVQAFIFMGIQFDKEIETTIQIKDHERDIIA
jgi:hypothetical protein